MEDTKEKSGDNGAAGTDAKTIEDYKKEIEEIDEKTKEDSALEEATGLLSRYSEQLEKLSKQNEQLLNTITQLKAENQRLVVHGVGVTTPAAKQYADPFEAIFRK